MPHSGKCDSGKRFLEPLAWEDRCGKCRMAYARRETCPCMYAVLPAGVLTTYPYVFRHPCSNLVGSHSGSFSNKADASAKPSPTVHYLAPKSVHYLHVLLMDDFPHTRTTKFMWNYLKS